MDLLFSVNLQPSLCPRNSAVLHLSPRLCLSSAECSPPSVPSIVFCLLLSCSRWFPPSLPCHLAIFYLGVPFISSLSLVATLCSVWFIYCLSFLLYVRPISIFVSVCIISRQLSLFFSLSLNKVVYLVALNLRIFLHCSLSTS